MSEKVDWKQDLLTVAILLLFFLAFPLFVITVIQEKRIIIDFPFLNVGILIILIYFLIKKGIIKKAVYVTKQKIDWITILLGFYMTTYGLCSSKRIPGYSYTSLTKATIAVGITLIVLGILIYRERAKAK